MPDLALLSVIAIVLLALVFDFTNGFHDAANSIATVVSTRVLTPRMAVIWAATFNFVAFFVFHTKVANTVGKTVDPAVVSEAVVFAGLVGAIAWNLFTWWLGLPTSSSHALIGGFAGAGVAKAGFSVLNAASLEKTILFIVAVAAVRAGPRVRCSCWPTCGCSGSPPRPGSTACSAASSSSRRPPSASATAATTPRRPWASSAPCWSAPATSSSRRTATCRSRSWVVFAAYTAISLGTLSGGWRIVKTLGQRITALKPVGGFSAETAAACSLYLATFLGVPVSTTHTITGAIVGVGATRRLSAVRWGVAGRIVWAWVLTIPAAAIIAAVTYAITVSKFAVAALILVAVFVAVVLAIRRNRRDIETVEPAEPAEPVEPAER